LSRFWDWSLGVYGYEPVARSCLQLQDEHGQNVPLLLWAAWSRIDDPVRLAPAAAVARAWEAAAVGPLRTLRRQLKAPVAGVADGAREDFRAKVKGVELDAERLLIAVLEPLAEPKGDASALHALTAASTAWGRPATVAALRPLSEAIEQGVAR
jgi:uncharacterized protein (TIGR02444 family)